MVLHFACSIQFGKNIENFKSDKTLNFFKDRKIGIFNYEAIAVGGKTNKPKIEITIPIE